MADELATPEELAARKKRADADRPDRTPYESLAGSHEHLTDDELAEQIADHEDRDVLLALWRRQRGDVKREDRDDEAVSVADQRASGVPAKDTVSVADQRQGQQVPRS